MKKQDVLNLCLGTLVCVTACVEMTHIVINCRPKYNFNGSEIVDILNVTKDTVKGRTSYLLFGTQLMTQQWSLFCSVTKAHLAHVPTVSYFSIYIQGM